MQHVKQKAEQSKDTREKIELYEDKMCLRGEPIPFRAYIPKEEVIKYRKDQKGGGRLIYKAAMKDPLTITAEEDEEQIIMRRMRNTVDELKRGYRWLDYRMQHVKQKAEQSKDTREKIELYEDKMCLRGEPIPFRAYIPKEEVIKYGKDQKGGGRLIYKGCKLNNRSLHNFRPTIGHYIHTYDICYATKIA